MKDTLLMSFAEALEASGGEWSKGQPHEGWISSVNTDSRKDAPGSLFIALPGESFDGHEYLQDAVAKGAALLCIEKGKESKIPPGAKAFSVGSTIEAYQRIANFHRRRFKDLKLVALTGSSGKTSTKEMLRAIFSHSLGPDAVLATEGNLNNHVGVPLTLMRLKPSHKVCIVEMGTNHHGEIEPLSKTAEPDIALIVSIGRCHLEHFGSLEGVAREKSSIFSHMKDGGTAIVPASGNCTETLVKAAQGKRLLRFGEGPDAAMRSIYLGGNIEGSSFELEDPNTGHKEKVSWSLSGRHQAANAAGAACAALAYGLDLKSIAAGLSACSLPGMRMKVGRHHGATWINDAYNANPDSMRAAIEWLSEFCKPESLLLALGDMREIGESAFEAHREALEFAVSKIPGARLVAVGEFMSEAASKLPQDARKWVKAFPDSKSAAASFMSFVKPGDTIFLKASRGTRLEIVEPQGQ